ncbi:MAG: TlpA family protein disulfide reductase [Gammaproteobacteria bacterium]|nr:TlpA family protein disulfide reductase [Gammaproteobacteria bacterium]
MKRLLFPLLLSLGLICSAAASPTPPEGILQLTPYAAPALTLSDIDGAPFSLPARPGQWVFVHFWASWCGPCRKEMPAIQRMVKILASEGLLVALINTAENEDTVFSFLAAHAPDIRALMDRDGLVTEQWQPRGLPATYLVGPDGRVYYQALGGRPWDEPTYLDFLRGLLKQTH